MNKRGLQSTSGYLLRYGLVLVIGWIGALKFAAFEAYGIQPLVENSPLMSWVYRFLSIRGFSNLLGIVEISVALLIAARPFSSRGAAVGSALAVVMFLTTLSFIFTTPGWHSELGFPALGSTGQFLLKDVVLLGAAVWSLQESVAAMRKPVPHSARPVEHAHADHSQMAVTA